MRKEKDSMLQMGKLKKMINLFLLFLHIVYSAPSDFSRENNDERRTSDADGKRDRERI